MEFILHQVLENTFVVKMTPEVFEDFKVRLLDYGTPFTESLYNFAALCWNYSLVRLNQFVLGLSTCMTSIHQFIQC